MNINSPINPATGLPMIGDGIGGVDIAGNPFGMGCNSHDAFSHSSLFDSSSSFSSSSFDWSSSFSCIGSPWD